MSVRSASEPRQQKNQSLKLARKLLQQDEPDIELALPYLLDALRAPDPNSHETACETLAFLGKLVVPALLDSWQVDDLEFRKRVILTLGTIGPPARSAIPLLTTNCADPYLGASARVSLDRIQRPVPQPAQPQLMQEMVAAAKSPWTWSRLLDLVLFIVAHPLTAALSCLTTILSLAHWFLELGHPARGIAPTVSASFALLGACIGGTIGARLHGFPGMKIGIKSCGTCGSVVGLFVGGLVGTLLQPLIQALGVQA
jgi:hypothetical protein